MARSLKKGPFVDEHLMKKVQEMNKSGKKEVIKHGHVVQLFFLILLDTLLQFIMVKNIFQFMLLKIW